MFNIFYKKNNNQELFSYLEKNGFNKVQNYIPLYENFFSLDENNFNNINLNQKYNINKIISRDNNNNFFINCMDISENNKKCYSFFKFSPLLDPTKFMVGKYDIKNIDKITNLPKTKDNNCYKKVLDKNNAAYVDSFFYYLSSLLLNKTKFIHGTDFFGSFLAIQNKFILNVFDDLEYLYDSEFYHKNKNKLFDVENIDEERLIESDTRTYRKKIKLGDNLDTVKCENIEQLELDSVFELTQENLEIHNTSIENSMIYENENENENEKQDKSCIKSVKKTESTCSSRSSNTNTGEEEGENEIEADLSMSDDSEYSSMGDEEVINATLHNFPVQIICIEQMENTLDYLMENSNKELDDFEWKSCFFQIIMILITYQKVFDFTHNDLHTNNIMYVKTAKKFLYYKYNNKHYKVPTYGRIYKIIDFGRAIFKFKGKQFCSDSYHHKGDAATLYNFGPYRNEKKPILEPNKSFDLCRFACSLYDYFFDDVDDVEEECKEDPLLELVNSWIKDDKDRNILYKKNDEERYPEFKLYKMIARTVHNNLPEMQVEKKIFRNYTISKKRINKKINIINIDKLPDLTK